jgi:hypothetical protein
VWLPTEARRDAAIVALFVEFELVEPEGAPVPLVSRAAKYALSFDVRCRFIPSRQVHVSRERVPIARAAP